MTALYDPPGASPLHSYREHGYFGSASAALAFSSLTLASVLSGSASAFFWQLLQQRNTGRSFTRILTGVPIEPSRLSFWTAQNFWARANCRSSGVSLSRAASISASSLPGLPAAFFSASAGP